LTPSLPFTHTYTCTCVHMRTRLLKYSIALTHAPICSPCGLSLSPNTSLLQKRSVFAGHSYEKEPCVCRNVRIDAIHMCV